MTATLLLLCSCQEPKPAKINKQQSTSSCWQLKKCNKHHTTFKAMDVYKAFHWIMLKQLKRLGVFFLCSTSLIILRQHNILLVTGKSRRAATLMLSWLAWIPNSLGTDGIWEKTYPSPDGWPTAHPLSKWWTSITTAQYLCISRSTVQIPTNLSRKKLTSWNTHSTVHSRMTAKTTIAQ